MLEYLRKFLAANPPGEAEIRIRIHDSTTIAFRDHQVRLLSADEIGIAIEADPRSTVTLLPWRQILSIVPAR